MNNKTKKGEEEYLYSDDILPIFLKFPTTPITEKPKSEYEEKILNIKKEFYITGNKKKELAEWYLELIENQTDKFLIEEDSFNFSVIPVMYLDTPPSSMSEIDRNLLIVRKHMDNLSFTFREDNNQTQPPPPQQQQPKQHNTLIYNKLVFQLINQVHRLIDIFVKESLCILYYDLSELIDKYSIDIYLDNPLVPYNNSNNNNNNNKYNNNNNTKEEIETIKIYNTMILNSNFNFKEFQINCNEIIKKLKRKQQNNNSELQELNPYIELLKDTNYLNTMQQYDREFFTMDHSTLSADDPVVGVTGLVLNRLHRLENELKTIQQHWNTTSINSHNQHYQSTSPFRR